MAQTAGALSKVLVGSSTASLSSAAATGGTGPYTYQWYRSTTSGFTPGASNILSGQTALTLSDSGLTGGTTYYYVVATTDTGNGNLVVNSSQLSVATEPGNAQNQFAQSQIVGVVDLNVGSTNVVACQVAASVTSAIYPGMAVKIVANTNGGIPQVQPISAKGDPVMGFVKFNVKDLSYSAGQNLEVCLFGTVIWAYATGAVTQWNQVCADSTYVGGVQATGNTATIVGIAVDGAAAAGPIRVMLIQNATYATA